MKYKNIKLILITIILILIITNVFLYISTNEDLLIITFIDVGQGDSILIITPCNFSILIDGGDIKYGSIVLEKLKKNNIDEIDFVIATHPHADHIGGLIEVLDSVDVNLLFKPNIKNDTETYNQFINTISENNIEILNPPINYPILISEDIKLKFLAPIKIYDNNINNNSIVTKLTYKNTSFLFTGDAEAESERDIISNFKTSLNNIDLLQVPHHGSSTSLSYNFFETINPSICVISVGHNNYGHPHKETIEKLKYKDLFITKESGNITFFSDGYYIWTYEEPIFLDSY